MIAHGSTRPRTSGTGSTGDPSRRGARTVLSAGSRAAVLVAVVLAATTACNPFPSSSSSSGGSQKAKDWAVGDCAGPDTSKSKDGFQALDCDDPKATLKALEVQDGAIFAQSVQCPAGTDEIISVKVSFGGGDASTSGIPTKTVCGRNLSGEHPGDAGAGGGQLVVGDCVDDEAKEIACAGASGAVNKVLALTKTAEECPAAANSPIDLFPSPGRPYDTICASAA
ncbi:hypothetical protein OG596_23600 [Streptomyces sp. NBC_01102]|uniref:hypothetical protein n=1 Tax=unclassified Streptomyces TaxID=2593676 RepID=UPI0038663F13|nr:hypothetical protein OG596_23600 [Streptomyces sp. NBC_01102]